MLLLTLPGIMGFAAGAQPGAMPAFSNWGPTTSSTTLAQTHTIAYPSTVNAGDLLIVSCGGKNFEGDAGLSMHASMAAAGFALVGGSTFDDTSGNQVHLLAWKFSDGTEGGSNIPGGVVGSGGSANDAFIGACARFTAADGFAANPFESIGLHDASSGFNKTVEAPTVIPAGLNRRAVAMCYLSHDSSAMPSFDGETGGDWTLAGSTGAGSDDDRLHVQTSDQSGGGQISGGSATMSSNTVDLVVGLALVPAQVPA